METRVAALACCHICTSSATRGRGVRQGKHLVMVIACTWQVASMHFIYVLAQMCCLYAVLLACFIFLVCASTIT